MSKKKKVVILSCMIALLAVTAVCNFVLTSNVVNASQSTLVSNANYFTQYRNERMTTRNEEIMQLDSIITASDVSSVERAEALSLKTELTVITEKEMLLESLIKAYGFEDVVVVIGIDSDNVNVIAKDADLTTDDAIIIYSIIAEECIAQPENVKIIPIS